MTGAGLRSRTTFSFAVRTDFSISNCGRRIASWQDRCCRSSLPGAAKRWKYRGLLSQQRGPRRWVPAVTDARMRTILFQEAPAAPLPQRHHHRRVRWRRAERNKYASVKEAHVREESLEISQSATEAINSGMDGM